MKVVAGLILSVFCLVAAENNHEEYIPFQGQRHDNFDWMLTKDIFEKEPGNVVLSPFSIKVILLLLAEASGIGSETFNQLQIIYPNIRVPYEGREVYKKVLSSLSNSNSVTMKTGTKILVQNGINTRPRYQQILEKYYETRAENVDFAKSTEVAQIVNNWAANLTDNNIQNLVTADDFQNSVAILLNAVYFKGAWRRPFKTEKTEPGSFSAKSGSVQASYMVDTDNYYFFESTQLNAKILRIPYTNGKFSMFVVLPTGDLIDLIGKLNSKTINREAWYLDEVEVKVKLPKFQFNKDTDLRSHLENLGIVDMFTDNAVFPLFTTATDQKATTANFKVSNIKQKAGIRVDEQGSEAFAATVAQIVNKFGAEPAEFLATKPFIFFIEDEATGTVLFAGKVEDPTKLQ